MADELKRAIASEILPALAPLGFHRRGTRDLVRVDSGIAQRLYFQLTGWGGRDFCVTCCANLISANDFATLQPGFRLGGGKWLPSLTEQQALHSIAQVLRWIMAEAIPFFERTHTFAAYAETITAQSWGSSHHGKFQRGVALAHEGRIADAQTLLGEARSAYLEDGSVWVGEYVAKIDALCAAMQTGVEAELLRKWIVHNNKAHGLK